MKKLLLTSSSALLIVLAGVALFLWQRQTTRQLRHELALRGEASRELLHVRAENARLRAQVAAPRGAKADEIAQGEIAKLRQEIATLEQTCRPAWAANIPPEGMIVPVTPESRPPVSPRTPSAAPDGQPKPLRIAEFQNVGQATPAACFQTLVWAAAAPDYDALRPLLGMSPEGREKLQALIDALPAEARTKFSSPEQLLGMFLELDLLKNEGFQINDATLKDADHAVLHTWRLGQGNVEPRDYPIPMQRGAGGWQIEIPDRLIDEMPQAIAAASLYVPSPPAR